jgi:hypothetical protein
MNKAVKIPLVILILILVFMQLIPNRLPENNSDLKDDLLNHISPPEDVGMILKNSCYDCHSNVSKYPWYSYVAPVSWLVAKDVQEGREELNFSEWATLNKRQQIKAMSDIAEEVEEGKMPLDIYTYIHRDAVLSEEQIESITAWTRSVSDDLLNE